MADNPNTYPIIRGLQVYCAGITVAADHPTDVVDPHREGIALPPCKVGQSHSHRQSKRFNLPNFSPQRHVRDLHASIADKRVEVVLLHHVLPVQELGREGPLYEEPLGDLHGLHLGYGRTALLDHL